MIIKTKEDKQFCFPKFHLSDEVLINVGSKAST